MNPKLLLGLALVLSGGLFGCSTASKHSAATDVADHGCTLPTEAAWQITLRTAVANDDLFPPFLAGWKYFYTVPADVARILESEPPVELLPFLANLQAEPPAWKVEEVDAWIKIVRERLRGKPSIFTCSVTSPNGRAIFEKEIPVYTYSLPLVAAAAKVKLKFISVDSEETNREDGYGKNSVDGDPNTLWHTRWQGKSPGLPHEIILELVPPAVIKGFTYLPRQDESDHGTIKDYKFYVSDDGRNFGQPVKTGAFGPGKGEKIETFAPIKCRFIELKAISEINGLPWTSAAEIRVIQSGEAASAKDYWRGDIGPVPSRHNFHKPDAIDSFVAAFLANGGLWLNGFDGMDALATSPQQVVLETLRTAHFESGMMTSYRILDMRKVHIGELGIYTAVLADTNLGEMIALLQNGSMPGHWWRRIYSADAPYNRLY